MKILVTGAAGYIGSHTVAALSKYGHTVTATDFRYQNDINHHISEYIHWDIREPMLSPKDEYDAVVHIAAATKVGASVLDPQKYYETNMNGTYNVISKVETDHFVYCSTGSAFNPTSSPYAATKYGGELITRTFCNDKHSLIRFYNVSGNNGFYKFDDEVSHLIRRAARVANNILWQKNDSEYSSMSIYGTDYDTRDGTCVRNYTHINDIVSGIVSVVDNGPTNDVVCLGSKEGFTVKEVIDTMKKVSGVDFEVNLADRRAGDVAVSTVPEPSVHFNELHTLEQMCEDALEYEKNF